MLRVGVLVVLALGVVIAGNSDPEQNVKSETLNSPDLRLELVPTPPEPDVEGKLIWYNASNEENVKRWTNEINTFLATYKKDVDNRVECDYDHQPEKGKVCNVNVDKWRPCISVNNFNFHKSSPCIFLKLNKIYNWKPEFYNSTDLLPSDMPPDLKYFIKDDYGMRFRMRNEVLVSCEGEYPADHENIGPIQYIPSRGFPGYYFPFMNTDGYLSPLVAVFFEKPQIGVMINIKCKAWAKNIHSNRIDQITSVKFQLLID